MGNPITDKVRIGTLGELLVQLRLLEHDVQAAPPIKDSGNDLVAVRGESFRGVQVKTTAGKRVAAKKLPKHYHIIALVYLRSNDVQIFLDQSEIFLISREEWEANAGKAPSDLASYAMSALRIEELFAEQ